MHTGKVPLGTKDVQESCLHCVCVQHSLSRQSADSVYLLELQLLDVLAKALLKDSEDLLSSALPAVHSLGESLFKLAAQAENEVHHATPAGYWGAPHAAQLLLQPSNACTTCMLRQQHLMPQTAALAHSDSSLTKSPSYVSQKYLSCNCIISQQSATLHDPGCGMHLFYWAGKA